MTSTEAKIIAILTETPKTWRELTPSFPDRVDFNLAMLSLEKRKLIRYSLAIGCYEVVR
ncbi:MAG TPA: hypothetical protein VMV63_07390 [Acidithiobacillus sp.]|nr:hypothetical protein [Acidithiobacillus sp.]